MQLGKKGYFNIHFEYKSVRLWYYRFIKTKNESSRIEIFIFILMIVYSPELDVTDMSTKNSEFSIPHSLLYNFS